jgi:hypothetical protein
MTLKVQGNLVTGVYESRVGDAKGVYSLTGFFDSELQSSNCIGWVVVWKNETENSDAVTTWSGQVQKDENKEDTIITTWLLTCETDVNDDWHSTMIGKDKFTSLLLL